MSKTITLRVSDEDYAMLTKIAKEERRPISNFITHFIFSAFEKEDLSNQDVKDVEAARQDLKEDSTTSWRSIQRG